jgi:shikimate kinase
MRIFLIGFMGAGKSFLGKALANSLDIGFVDLDEVIEKEAGMHISAIFETMGEATFRQLEAAALRSLLDLDDIVVATGGGAPCFNDNMDWMNENGVTVYLFAEVPLLARRLRNEMIKRPLLAALPEGGLEDFLHTKIAEREAYYGKSQLQFDVPQEGFSGIDALTYYLKRFFSKNN